MKLYLVHTGFYDPSISKGFFESHSNYFIIAENEKSAKIRMKQMDEFKDKKMHIDGIMELNKIGDYHISINIDPNASDHENKQFSYNDVKRI
tara:strand:+ start:520 stop:795 length:276 start_codon:yes stop_codon:yes gene_type:complete